MLNLIRQVLRVGDATRPYPFVPAEVMPGFRGKPQHDPQRCLACGACAVACPPNALSMSTDLNEGTRTWSLFVGRCIYCGRCEEVCPTHAITLSQDFELAVMNKTDLYETASYALAACARCGRYYAPRKELDYAAALLQQSGLAEEALARARAWLNICPGCRRMQEARKIVNLFQEAPDESR
jgi:formate hydrogenlyase subunit 6/NADH:ubiquinone oxidoreductase subunit I